MDFPISAFKKQVLKEEYILRSKILHNLSGHIEKLNTENIIHHSLRSKYMCTLNGIVKELNESYNLTLRGIKDSSVSKELFGVQVFEETHFFYRFFNTYLNALTDELYDRYNKLLSKNDDNKDNNISYEEFSATVFLHNNMFAEKLGGLDRIMIKLYNNVSTILPLIKYKNSGDMRKIKNLLNLDMFKDIDSQILKLSGFVGFGKYDDAFLLLLGNCYRDVLSIDSSCDSLRKYLEPYHRDKSNLINLNVLDNKIQRSYACFDILSRTFIPVKTIIKTGTAEVGIKVEKKINTYESIKENTNKFKYEILLDNCYRVTTKTLIPNVSVIYVGYFNYDAVNVMVRTCKINSYFLNVKNTLLQKYIDINAPNVDDTFRTIYAKNLQVGDILSHTGESLKDAVTDDYYNIYSKYTSTKFRQVLNEFLRLSLPKKYYMLKILLMGHKDAVKYAGLLYALTKEQHRDSKNNNTVISSILYRNLNYPLQCKLKKSGYYIKDEMERLKDMSCEDIDLKKQVLISMTMPDNIKKIAIAKIDEMKSNNSEYYKYFQYVKCLIDYPWMTPNESDIFKSFGNNLDKSQTFLNEIMDGMNKLVYGHKECKDVIVELLAKWMSNPNSMGKAIGLCGPPGVGKTLIAKGLGKVLNIPFSQINVGGLDDASVLSGHSITYSGAQYGLIVRKMCENGKSRCILFFDELDKACTRHGINEIYNTLIHATDPNTNGAFNDKYFQEVQFPLSNVLFIFSFNKREKVDKILLDRMEILNANAYSINDKINIVKEFLLKEILESFNLEQGSVTICDDTIMEIIEEYTFEAGVRNLKRKLDTICSKMNVDRIYQRGPFKNRKTFSKSDPIVIKMSDVHKYLSKPNMSIKKIHTSHEIGILSGLYATDVGSGGIIPILMYPNHTGGNKFHLKLTGSQGKVMKESVMYSFTLAMNCVQDSYRKTFLSNHKSGLHIHTPDGATPKDGPSAGSAFTTAFISRILGKHIKRDIAMTGEIEINGQITKIGGLDCKLAGAKKAGVKLVFCPRENAEDLAKVAKSNPYFLTIWNPNNQNHITKLIEDCKKDIEEKKNKFNKQHEELNDDEKIEKVPTDFRVLLVEHVKDVLEFALIDDVTTIEEYDTYKSYFNPDEYLEGSINSSNYVLDTNIYDSIEDEDEDEDESHNSNADPDDLNATTESEYESQEHEDDSYYSDESSRSKNYD